MSLRRIVFVIVGVAIALARPMTLAQSQAQTAAPVPAVGPVTVVPVQITGDDASRFTLVVLADGYTAADMPAFRRDLDKHLNILWSLEPFRSYRNYFNVYAVEAASQDSGLTCDPLLLQEPNMDPALRQRLQQKNTLFGLNFGGGCTSVNARGVTPTGNRNATVREYAAKATANPDQILIIGNSRTYGGIGGGIATSTGSNSLSPLITPHEIGHSLGRLTDEYTYGQRGVAGGTYRGNEPGNVHTTLLTEEEMKTQQKKWWRWLGEPSESGGVIGRYEGGSGNTKGIWRPSKHSMMISLGYFFDQVSREQMVRQISARVGLIAASTPTDQLVPRDAVLWIRTAHPVYHDLQITWTVADKVIPNPDNSPYLDLAKIFPIYRDKAAFDAAPRTPGEVVTVTVVDPTGFVRDPEIRKAVLTATKSWALSPEPAAAQVHRLIFWSGVTGSTQTQRPLGGSDVVYVESAPQNERDLMLPAATWRLDNAVVVDAANKLTFPLASRRLSPGTHTLSVTVNSPDSAQRADPSQVRRWTIDNTMPTVAYTLNKIVATLPPSTAVPASEPHSFMRDEFTMKLDPKDDQPGYVVAEFRVNGDGWHHYYGWPDAPPGTPFKFTARGTNIKELIYGSLSSEGLSPQPWEPREPGWGTHRIEYRAKDAAGNIGPANAFRVTVMPSLTCTSTLTGPRLGDVKVDTGVTCLDAATVTGNVVVAAGATLIATNSKISGALTSTGAATIELVATSINGVMAISGTTGRVTIFGVTVGQAATVSDSRTTTAPLVTGSTFKTTLGCSNNSVTPTNGGSANTTARGATGQCG